ncbi:MAG: chorismate-binding protein [Verrucomicrobiaceae bacterium]|nr:chorismate-binding protein [Verrucomicrobiaceae bacterium]
MTDLALFRLPDGQAWLGLGPFAEQSAQPTDSPAFYVNDFSLSDPKPWKIPAKLIQATTAQLPDDSDLKVTWGKPATEWFKMAFRRIRREVLAGRLTKMVPVLTELGQVATGNPASVLRRALTSAAGTWAYGWSQGDHGFAGATPELLFQLGGGRLETMALAGTAKPGADEAFLNDAKEIEEHEIVVRYIMEQLSTYGPVQRGNRGMMETAGLRHFQTPLSLGNLNGKPTADDLVKCLHPTPAVGCLPRSDEWLERLREYRQQLKVPGFFGAPFGFSFQGTVHVVVAIRGVSWNGNAVSLPSGCGVVGGSAFDHEWREVRLKREAVVRSLGL